MGEIEFDWDPRRSNSNQAKHGVSFDEAASAFEDDSALLIADPAHSGDEDRFVLLGLSARARLLVVVHCYRESDSIIRIISARRATRHEHDRYAKGAR
jgi:uncharacterized DUF497 family protein